MTSDHTQPITITDGGWHEPTAEWVTSLKDDDGDGTIALRPPDEPPRTVSDLVLVPGYTQSAWDRRQVRQLQTAMAAETYLWDNLHKTDEVLVYDLLLMLGYERAASAHMAAVTPEPICAEVAAPAAKPKRRRPSQTRKTVRGAPPDAAA